MTAEALGRPARPTAPRPAARRRRCSAPARLAHSLGIPHLTLDLEDVFRRRVVGEFLAGYAAGQTPNPCVLCNGEVRIAAMVDLAERLGAAGLVTGHYARIVDDGDGPLLAAAADPAKDQSYMLAALPPPLLGRLRFPLAELPQARGAGDRRPPRPGGRPQAREPGPLLPRRAGQARVPAPPRRPRTTASGDDRRPRRPARSAATAATTTSPSASAAASASPPSEPLYVLATDAASNTVTVGARAELETRRGAGPRRRPAPRRRHGRRGPAPLPLRVGAGVGRRRRTAPAATTGCGCELARAVRRAGARPDRGAAARRDDRRPRHDRLRLIALSLWR